MADGFCKRLTDWWAAHPDFDNCRSVGSLKACVPSGYVVAWSRAVHVPERLRLQGRLPQRVIESFNGKFRDECLNQNVFLSLHDARRTVEAWRQDYNQQRPHSSLGWLTPEEFREKNITCNPLGTTNLQVVYAVG